MDRCGTERRKYPRMNVRLDVGIGPKDEAGRGIALDLSEGGMLITAASAVMVGTSLKIHLKLDGMEVETTGKVAWRGDDDHGVRLGVEFVELSRRGRKTIREYIRRQAPYLYPIGSVVPTPPRPRAREDRDARDL